MLVEGAVGGGPGLASLDPWSPALAPSGDSVRSGPDGRLGRKVAAPGPSTVTLDWEQRARPGTEGRAFDLALPDLAATSLTIDLPAGWLPEAPGTLRQGPAPGSSADRRSWRLDGPGGAWALTLRGADGPGAPAGPSWVSGTTRIDLGESPPRWQAEWTVDPGSAGPRSFSFELPPSLEWIDAAGPAVATSRAEPSGPSGTVVTVRLSEGGPSSVIVRAVAKGPEDGPWTVPAAIPRDATWTGGRTVVRLGAAQVVASCRERSGRQVSPRADEAETARGGTILAFEGEAPGPVADLVIRRPPTDVSAEVRGTLKLGPPRIEAAVTWRVDRGRVFPMALDLPPGWVLQGVRLRGETAETAWHVEARPGGGARLVVRPPAAADPAEPIVLDLSADAPSSARFGPLDLPRVSPVGVRAGDEVWTLRADSAVAVAPIRARGLAWMDPASIAADPAGPSPPVASPPPILAWRWTAADGRGVLERRKAAEIRTASAWVRASLDADRLRLDLFASVPESGDEATTVLLGTDSPLDPPPVWETQDGRAVESAAIPEAERAALGLPAGGSAWRLRVPNAGAGRPVLHGRSDRKWTGQGRLPILAMPGADFVRGGTLVAVARGMRSVVRAEGLRALDPSAASAEFRRSIRPSGSGESATAPGASPGRVAHAFAPDGREGSLRLETSTLPAEGRSGLVERAELETGPGGAGPSRARLTLRIVPGTEPALKITLPDGARLERARLDGHPIVPSETKGALRIPLPPASTDGRTHDLVLDYETAAGDPALPSMSVPCLAFGWSLDVRGSLDLEQVGPGLIDSTPRAGPPESPRILPGSAWSNAPPEATNPAILSDLDARARRIASSGLSLGDWLTRLDSSRFPLVIDRRAMEGLGLGPKSSLPRGPAAGTEVLGALGLGAWPLEGVVMLSDRPPPTAEADPEGRSAWAATVRAAIVEGSDPADRFQAVERWAREAAPPPPADDPPDSGRIVALEAAGWPDRGATVTLDDRSARRTRAVLLFAAVVGLGAASGRRRMRIRAGIWALGTLSAAGILAIGPAALREAASAVLWGAVAVPAIWLGRSIRSDRPGPGRDPRSRASRRPSMRSGSTLAVLVATSWVVGAPRADDPAGEPPILALIPYDPPLDPERPGKDVLLRLEDDARLRKRATAAEDRPSTSAGVFGASHRIAADGPSEARITSEFDLVLGPTDGSEWSFPIEGARDVSARLDGKDIPVRITSGGKSGTISLAGEGVHKLTVDRRMARTKQEGGTGLRLSVPPVATARVAVEATAPGEAVDVPNARGRLAEMGGGVAGPLGPVGSVEVRWTPREAAGRSRPRGEVDVLALWDVEPAGDHVRLRLSPASAEGLSRAVVKLGPGVLVRSSSLPGRLVQDEKGSTWSARLDPPRKPGESIALELWKAAPPISAPSATPSPRRLPRFELSEFEKVTGLLGVRRPGEWTGRLGPAPGREAVADDVFDRAWGPLPAGGGTLAGAFRFAGSPELDFPTGPEAPRSVVQPAVLLEIGPGRLDLHFEAAWADLAGRTREVRVRVPRDLRVVRVEAPGLTDWGRSAEDRLRFRFDGPPSPSRTIRIDGWVPIDGDPMDPGTARNQADVPWPVPLDADLQPGTLAVAAPANVRFELVGAAEAIPSAPGGPIRSTYRVPPGEVPGRLAWAAEPSGVNVLVRSLLRVHPDSSEWAAVVRYRIPWGPCPPVRLRLPTEWAEAARVEILGRPVVPEALVQGDSTVWTFRPEPPAWGSLQVAIRASRPRPPKAPLAFPDLVPLGRAAADRVDSYLAVADASGLGLVPEGSAGLQPVEASRWGDGGFPLPAGTRGVYRVLSEGWSLRLIPRSEPAGEIDGLSVPTVTLADLLCVVAPDGSSLGRASYHLDDPSSAFLPLIVPNGIEALSATVDGSAVSPRRDGPDRLLIPLPDGGASRVILLWKAPAGPDLPVPALMTRGVPTLLDVAAPEADLLRSSLPASPPDALGASRLEQLARSIADRISRIDRGSTRDRSALLGALIRFEATARQVDRQARFARRGAAALPEPRVSAARQAVAEALSGSGLEEFGQSARSRVGEAITDPMPSLATPPLSPEPNNLRRLGKSRTFQGIQAEPGRPIKVSRTPRSTPVPRPPAARWLPPLLPILAGLVLVGLIGGRRSRISAAILTAAASATATILGGGPLVAGIAAGAVVVGLGWRGTR